MSLLTAGIKYAGIAGGITGAGLGFAAGARTSDDAAKHMVYGAAAGAAIGVGGLPVIGAAAVGTGYLGVKAVKNSYMLGDAVVGGAKYGYGAAKALGKEAAVGRYGSHIGQIGEAIGSIAKNIVKYKPSRLEWDEGKSKWLEKGGHLRLTGLGYGMVAAGTGMAMIRSTIEEQEQSRMGTMDQEITTVTPRQPAYAGNAGATGDLVFALHKNRRG